jgi:hypothetical protein
MHLIIYRQSQKPQQVFTNTFERVYAVLYLKIHAESSMKMVLFITALDTCMGC